jgi:hypothetical protein
VKGWLIITTVNDEIEEENVPDDEIDPVCQAFARILVLLDKKFSMLMTPQGQVTAELMAKSRSQIEGDWLKWNKLNLSLTPKWHVLLDHAADHLEQIIGFADMGKDSMEQNHQSQEKDHHQNSHLRDKQHPGKDLQARYQHIGSLDEVKKI